MPPDKNKALIQTINKIPFFKGLSPSQAQSVISICAPRSFAAEEIVCEGGTESNEMFIFLSGELGVVTPDGIQVATILPVTTVGEIGIATRQMRTATVKATKKSNLLVIKRVPLEQLLKSDAELLARIYRSLIEILAQKIVNDNIRIRDHLVAKVNGERRVKQQRRRVTLAMDLLEQKAGMERGEIEAYLVAHMGDEEAVRVLVADDEAPIRQVIADALSKFDVVQAEKGVEALKIVEEQAPDLVITDIKMPEMDGFALLKELRARRPDLPVLALSGYIEEEEAQAHKFDGFIPKPLRVDEFRQLVEATLSRD